MASVADFASVGLDDEEIEEIEEVDEGDEELLDEVDDEGDTLSDLSIESDESCLTSSEEDPSDEDLPTSDMFGSVATAFKQYRKTFRPNKVVSEASVDRAVVTNVLKELMAADGFTTRVVSLADIALLARRPNGDLMACFWDPTNSNKVGIEQMRIINDLIRSMNIKRALVVAQQPITAKAASSLHPNACVVLERSLAYNYTEHVLVPKQVAVVAPSVLTAMKINPDKLPKMSSKDPIAVYFGWKIGTVVRSRRVLGGAMEPHDYFREICEVKH